VGILGVALLLLVVPPGAAGPATGSATNGGVVVPHAWILLHPSTAPSKRDGQSMVYDIAAGAVVLFGGEGYSHAFNDTWTFRAGVWTDLGLSHAPPGRSFASFAYDPDSQRAILFGGVPVSSSIPMNDTWAFANGTWHRLSVHGAPPAVFDASFVFDPAMGRLVLYGGYTWNSSAHLGAWNNATWSWANGSWTKIPTSSVASGDISAAAYDPTYGGIVLVGPVARSGTTIGTWLFRNGSWSALSVGVEPPQLPGQAQSLVLDPTYHFLLLVGPWRDTWRFHNGSWTQLHLVPTSTPKDRYGFGLTFDAHDRYVLLFGGFTDRASDALHHQNDTWTY